MNRNQFQCNLIQLQTITIREVTRFTRIWIQTIIPPVIMTVLYFIIFGHLIGEHIPKIHGYHYMEFIVPGLIMMAIINNSFANVVSSFFSAKFQRFIEELLVSPTSNLIILLGYLSGGILRGLVVAVIVSAISAYFTPLHIIHPLFMIVIVFLTSTLFSLGGFINAAYAKKFDDVSLIPTFILQPLTYLGGVFYSISLLPPFWQKISLANPILYIINAFRYSFLGISDIDIRIAFIIMFSLTAILFWLALHILKKGYGLKN